MIVCYIAVLHMVNYRLQTNTDFCRNFTPNYYSLYCPYCIISAFNIYQQMCQRWGCKNPIQLSAKVYFGKFAPFMFIAFTAVNTVVTEYALEYPSSQALLKDSMLRGKQVYACTTWNHFWSDDTPRLQIMPLRKMHTSGDSKSFLSALRERRPCFFRILMGNLSGLRLVIQVQSAASALSLSRSPLSD